MNRIAKQLVVGAQKTEVHPPRIDSDAANRFPIGLMSLSQPLFDICPEPE